MEASGAATLAPPIGAGRNWSFAAGTYSRPRRSGTRTFRNLTVSQPTVQNLTGKVSEFRYLSGERLFTVPSSATTFTMHEMLREHFQLPVSCLFFAPADVGLGAGAEPCSYHVLESTHALKTLEPAEVLEAGRIYRRCYLCQDFRADVVDCSDPDVMACEACGFLEWLCASCLTRTTVEGSGLFVHCILCLSEAEDALEAQRVRTQLLALSPSQRAEDALEAQRVRTQLLALSPSQRAWLRNFPRWLPEDYRGGPNLEEVD